MEAKELREALAMALEWIDAVPQETVLPAMPGFDRDWANGVLAKASRSPSHAEGGDVARQEADRAVFQVIRDVVGPSTPATAWETLCSVMSIVEARMEARIAERLSPSPDTVVGGREGLAAVFSRAICESEGKDWVGLNNSRADCERWFKSGEACVSALSSLPVDGGE